MQTWAETAKLADQGHKKLGYRPIGVFRLKSLTEAKVMSLPKFQQLESTDMALISK